jgi:hypothetical protein
VNRLVDRILLGPRRRRRWMERRLAELDRVDRGLRPRRRAGARGGLVTAGAFLVFLVGAGLMLRMEFGVRISAEGVEGTDRLMPEVAARDAGGSFSFAQVVAGQPVRYSPCRRISIRVNDRLEPAAASGLVREAATHVSAVTGLRITVDGTSTQLPDWTAADSAHTWSNSGPAQVLVAWTTPSQDRKLRGRPAGVGGSTAHPGPNGAVRYAHGAVSLDTPVLARMLTRPNGRAHVRAVILHELAHAVGLGHVDDPRELMYEDNVGLTSFGPGDLQGLALLGQGPCW